MQTNVNSYLGDNWGGQPICRNGLYTASGELHHGVLKSCSHLKSQKVDKSRKLIEC